MEYFIHKIDDGMKQFIPITSRFHSTKWKRPLKEEIRQQIRLKKFFGGNIFEKKMMQVG